MTRVHLQTPCYSFLVYRLIWYTRHNQPKSLRFKRLTLGHSSYSWQKTATVSPLGAVAPPSSSLVHVWFGTCQLNPWRLQEFFSMLFLRALQTSDLASFWGSFHGVSMMFHDVSYMFLYGLDLLKLLSKSGNLRLVISDNNHSPNDVSCLTPCL